MKKAPKIKNAIKIILNINKEIIEKKFQKWKKCTKSKRVTKIWIFAKNLKNTKYEKEVSKNKKNYKIQKVPDIKNKQSSLFPKKVHKT